MAWQSRSVDHDLNIHDEKPQLDNSVSLCKKEVPPLNLSLSNMTRDTSLKQYPDTASVTRQKPTYEEFLLLNARLWSVVAPAILSQVTFLAVGAISMLFVGHMDNAKAIAGVGLSIIYIDCTTLTPLTGLNNAISVLVSIAYGQQDLNECERILHRGRIICFLCTVPIFLVILMMEPVLVGVGVDPGVAVYAQEFGTFLYFAMVFQMQFDCYREYLNATNQSKIVTVIVATTTPFHILLSYLMIDQLGWGVSGVGASTVIICCTNWLMVSYICMSKIERKISPIPGTSLSSLLHREDLRIYFGISVPSIAMLCAEWWAYEILVVMATQFGTSAVGAMAISFNYFGLMIQGPYGFHLGATAVLGNIVGEENERSGKILSIMTVAYSTLISTVSATGTYFYAREIATIYTWDEETIPVLTECLKSLSIAMATVGAVLSLQAIMKALLMQVIASKILILCFYLISLPMAWWVAMEMGVGVTGLWPGLASGMIIIAILYAFFIWHSDWQAVFALNRQRKHTEEREYQESQRRSKQSFATFEDTDQ